MKAILPHPLSRLRSLIPLLPGWAGLLFIARLALIELGASESWTPIAYQTSPWPRVAGLLALTALFFKWDPPLKPGDLDKAE